MKLFHTADVHLDHCFAACRVPAATANWRRQHLREIFMELLRSAASEDAAALLIAGDLFEAQRVTRDTVAFLREAFDLARPVPVFIAPGQHDPYGPTSPYATESWPENVHIFRVPEWEAFRLPEIPLVVHGAACVEGGPEAPPFDKLRIPEDDATHVAVVHTNWCVGTGEVDIPPPEIPPRLAYFALGHAHDTHEAARKGPALACYSGAPEALAYGQPGPPGYLVVTFKETAPTVEAVATKATLYLEQTIDCGELINEAQVTDAVAGIGRAQQCDTIARIILRGRRPAGTRFVQERITAEAGKSFVHLEFIDETTPAPRAQGSAPEPGTLGLFRERMRKDIEGTTDPKRKVLLRRTDAVGHEAYLCALTGGGPV